MPAAFGSWEKSFAAAFAVAAIHYFFMPFGALGVVAQIVAIVLGIVVAYRFARVAVPKMIWRLRNRLIVSYLFIAVVPITLLASLVGIVAYMVLGQVAIYVVSTELDRRLGALPAPHQMPSQELLSTLAPNLGDVFFLDAQQDLRRRRVPPAWNAFDIELSWASPVSIESQRALLVVRSRPSAVLRHVFGERMEWGRDIMLLAMVLAGLLFVMQLVSILIGASITRTITSEVHDLYEGTRRVKEGDFSHRIAVRGDDQLAELSRSFNGMTENLQRLIVVEKEKERLHSELEIAHQVQMRLFPKGGLAVESLQLTGMCQPAQTVSGDYYDFLSLPDSALAMALGDVAGKGISAALLMATIQSSLRSQLTAATTISTAQIVSMLNRQLFASTAPEKFATFYFGIYDHGSGKLTYTNAGHLPPLLVRDGAPRKLEVTGTVVGAFANAEYAEEQIALIRGDLLVAYTDGITEPENSYGEMFGEERLCEVLVKYKDADFQEIIGRTVEAVRHWTGSPELQDDMTLLLARKI
ncbi:MAG: SpoIIE family protein phosphatase [Bryobacteraceae bacterium]